MALKTFTAPRPSPKTTRDQIYVAAPKAHTAGTSRTPMVSAKMHGGKTVRVPKSPRY